MIAPLFAMFRWLVGFAIFKTFTAIVIGVLSFAIVQYFFDQYVNAALGQVALMGDTLAYMGIAQLDTGISVIIGAMSIKAFMKSVRISLGRTS